MIHGNAWEAKSRAVYQMMTGCEVADAGFVTNDAGTAGASPDGFVGEELSVEFKSPFRPEIHMGYVLEPELLTAEYFLQTQMQLAICERKAVDLVSYFAGLPIVVSRVTLNIEFQGKLKAALDSFVSDLALLVELAKDKGWITERAERPAKDDGLTAFGVNPTDIVEYIASLKRDGKLPYIDGISESFQITEDSAKEVGEAK